MLAERAGAEAAGAGAAAEAAGPPSAAEEPAFLAACSLCGATRVLGVDLAELGINDFVCSLAGCACDDAAEPRAAGAAEPRAAGAPSLRCGAALPPGGPRGGRDEAAPRPAAGARAAEELEQLAQALAERALDKLPAAAREAKLPAVRDGILRRLRRLSGPREEVRYRHGEVATKRGERYVAAEGPWAGPAPRPVGTSIGGVIGSQRLGRRGLGFKKRPEAEVDRIRLSNKQRVQRKVQVCCTSRDRGPAVVHAGFRRP